MRSGEEMERDERYDSMIDRALRSYAEPAEFPETRMVLARVMEKVRASESQRRGWWMWGVVAAAGLAVVVLVGVVWMTRSSRGPEIAWVPKAPGVMRDSESNNGAKARHLADLDATRVQSCADTKACSGGVGGIPAARNNAAQRDEARESLPKHEVFPTPRPLSAEEQALVAFANNVPAKVQQQVIEAQKHVGDPIVIAELKIEPLESGEKQDSNEQKNEKER